MCRKLNDLGIIPNKTYNSVSLPSVPFEYYNHMLRGFLMEMALYIAIIKKDILLLFLQIFIY